jgi:fumarylpyruvate hydrolase
MAYVIDAGEREVLPVAGTDGTFPVRRVFCVGRNYAEHAREMGHDPDREPPFFFAKDAAALTLAREVPYPPATKDLHHEFELVVALGTGGENIPAARAQEHIFGYAVGIDLTRRDLQAEAKRLARPWYLAKSFVDAAPIGPLQPAAAIGHPRRGRLRLAVNGEPRQEADLAQMIWSIDEMIAILSRHDRLLAGDLVFTGTPAGVGPVRPGDRMEGEIGGVGRIDVTLTPRRG